MDYNVTNGPKSVVILGRQPAIGLAELESLFGAEAIQTAGPIAATLTVEPKDVGFLRLGGGIKLARYLVSIDTIQWTAIEKTLRQLIQKNVQYIPEGKIKFGLSVHGFDISVAKLNASGLSLKKAFRAAGRSVRVIPNKELELNSAQVLHNQLTSPVGIEFLIIRNGSTTIIAQTTNIQDIDAYAARDQGRPKRDARVGMLPPKLAQTIVNLASGQNPPTAEHMLLDPFCGTGVILQEALLMGYSVYGTDLEPRMVEYSGKNLDWLHEQGLSADTTNAAQAEPITAQAEPTVDLETGDATSYIWKPAPHLIATETYLGQPFNSFPPAEKLAEVRNVCNVILRKFLQNIGSQIKPGTRLCLAIPAWQHAGGSFTHLPTLDHLEELGYNRVSFKHVGSTENYIDQIGQKNDRNDLKGQSSLVYARTDQIVARELLVLIKT